MLEITKFFTSKYLKVSRYGTQAYRYGIGQVRIDTYRYIVTALSCTMFHLNRLPFVDTSIILQLQKYNEY